jgi:RNA polymerase sigma factor (sigma-70 family)
MLALHQLNLSLIIEGCREISRQQRKTQQSHCFELFRRAIEKAENQAWQALKAQYDSLIHHWIIGFSRGVPLRLQDREDLVQDTWIYFHRALKKYHISLGKHFEHVGALLKYLNNCAYTATMKHWKRRQKARRLQQKLEKLAPKVTSAPEEGSLTRLFRQERLAGLKTWCEQYMTDPQEQVVFDCTFKKDLKPKQIVEAYPEMFPNAKAVSRIKEKLIKRIKRYFSE